MKRAGDKRDMGERPSWWQRQASAVAWSEVDLAADVALRVLGKDYDLSRMMLRHFMTGDGSPLVYAPPQPVQDAIAKRYPAPGRYREQSGYGGWSTPDIRNGLGHFNLDVIPDGKGGRMYVVTDRYEFPEAAAGRKVEHGFQVGKPSKQVVETLNGWLSSYEPTRHSGAKDNRFELRKDPSTGDYTFFVPQRLIVDNGVDFESMGVFTIPASGR